MSQRKKLVIDSSICKTSRMREKCKEPKKLDKRDLVTLIDDIDSVEDIKSVLRVLVSRS